MRIESDRVCVSTPTPIKSRVGWIGSRNGAEVTGTGRMPNGRGFTPIWKQIENPFEKSKTLYHIYEGFGQVFAGRFRAKLASQPPQTHQSDVLVYRSWGGT